MATAQPRGDRQNICLLLVLVNKRPAEGACSLIVSELLNMDRCFIHAVIVIIRVRVHPLSFNHVNIFPTPGAVLLPSVV